MTTPFNLPIATDEEWMAELKPYQRAAISALLADNSMEEAAKIWLSSTGCNSVISFGGRKDAQPFWDRFKAEFHKFVCGDPAYEGDRAALGDEGNTLKTIAVSAIAASIGATIGMTATLLAPAVVLMLCIVGKVGKNAYCAAPQDQI